MAALNWLRKQNKQTKASSVKLRSPSNNFFFSAGDGSFQTLVAHLSHLSLKKQAKEKEPQILAAHPDSNFSGLPWGPSISSCKMFPGDLMFSQG